MFYSMEVRAGTPQGVHFLAFNSETYVDGGIEEMLNFMRADLATVDRKRTPWVVAFSHKHFWMDSTDFSEITGILQEGGVDLLFAGHWCVPISSGTCQLSLSLTNPHFSFSPMRPQALLPAYGADLPDHAVAGRRGVPLEQQPHGDGPEVHDDDRLGRHR
jgi:hypothetical protein